MTSKYKTKEHNYKQVVSYLTTDDKDRLRDDCHSKGLTMTGLIRRELLQLISNENKCITEQYSPLHPGSERNEVLLFLMQIPQKLSKS